MGTDDDRSELIDSVMSRLDVTISGEGLPFAVFLFKSGLLGALAGSHCHSQLRERNLNPLLTKPTQESFA